MTAVMAGQELMPDTSGNKAEIRSHSSHASVDSRVCDLQQRGPRMPRPPRGPQAAVCMINLIGRNAGTVHLRTLPKEHRQGRAETAVLTLPIKEEDLAPFISANENKGQSIFFVVNEGGQRGEDITNVRALFVDYDGDDLAGFEKRLALLPVPHIVVESSPGRRHVYWLVKGIALSDFRPLQRALIERLGTDKSIIDLPRIMRLPGFLNHKREPFTTQLISLDSRLPPYPLEDIKRFTVVHLSSCPTKQERPPSIISSLDEGAVDESRHRRERAKIDQALSYLADHGWAEDHSRWQRVGACLKGCTRSNGPQAAVFTDPEGLRLFMRFSRSAKNFDPDGVRKRWPNIGDAVESPGALFVLATSAGWQSPSHSAREPNQTCDSSPESIASDTRDEALVLDSKGRLISCVANAIAFLARENETAGALQYNLFTNTILYRGNPLQEADVIRLQAWMQRQSDMRRITRPDVETAIRVRADTSQSHPIRDWLNSISWDGVHRLDSWLSDYLGVKPSPYSRLVARMFLIGMVARVMKPGCKLDNMLILEGGQGQGKSTALRVLAGGHAYFSDHLPDIRSKDASQALRGRWIVEAAELAGTSKADIEALKAFLSRDTERYRPPYGRLEVNEPRQCVVTGTTNDGQYLRDPSGARRFWPIRVGTINTEGLAEVREQLFAEAMRAYMSGEGWWPTTDEQEMLFRPEQEARFETDPWEDAVVKYLAEREADRDPNTPLRVTVSEIASSRFLNIEINKTTTRESRRIANILTRLGYVQRRTARERLYEKQTRDVLA